jgi:hypothetical protein
LSDVIGGWRGAFSPESPAAPTSGRDMKILFIFLAITTSTGTRRKLCKEHIRTR